MCGIYGLWADNTSLPHADLQTVLRHRGPDDCGAWSQNSLHLGHLRLSILDLSPQGRQPISTPDGRFTLTYNGEIYNFLELRSELESKGITFVSDSDTEVLLQGFAHWGSEVLPRLRGMFAFAIWDSQKKNLFLARDPSGVKPLYYCQFQEDGFAFASEVKAFGKIKEIPLAIDEGKIREYLGTGFLWDGDGTIFKGVKKLSPGHCLTVAAGCEMKLQRWWKPPLPDVLNRPLHEALNERADALFALLQKVTAQQLRADVPVGLLLSGGLDSSILAALAARHLNQPLRTITLGFEPYEKDERKHARLVANSIGSQHREVLIRPEDAANELFRNAHHFDDLFADSGTIPAFAAFQACREQGLKVVLVGEGADELFGGYPQFRTLGGAKKHGKRFFQTYTRQRYGPEHKAFDRLIEDLHHQAGGDWFQTVRLFELTAQLPVSLNQKVDHASMANSLEARVPFQDPRIIDFALRLPRELLLEDSAGKLLLRHMVRRHKLIPEAIIDRKKMGTPVPWEWITAESAFSARAQKLLLNSDSWTTRLGLSRLVRDVIAGRAHSFPNRYLHRFGRYANPGWVTMNLLVLEAWSRSTMFTRG